LATSGTPRRSLHAYTHLKQRLGRQEATATVNRSQKINGVPITHSVHPVDLYGQALFREAAGAEFRPGGLALTEELATAARLSSGDRVLDLGCGVGSTASYLARDWHVEATGLDASPGFLAEAGSRDPVVQWVLGHSAALPFAEAHFDAVFAECFLSAQPDRDAVLHEVRRVLRPGGRLAVSDTYLRDPAALAEGNPAPPCSCLSGATGKDETLASLERAGFSVELWLDRSNALRALMASLVFAYGSAAAFWKAANGGLDVNMNALSAARPGYYLLVASPWDG
jgi:arsenite methyltransferase